MDHDQTAPLEQFDLGPLCLLRDFCHNVEGRYDKSCIVSCIVYGCYKSTFISVDKGMNHKIGCIVQLVYLLEENL